MLAQCAEKKARLILPPQSSCYNVMSLFVSHLLLADEVMQRNRTVVSGMCAKMCIGLCAKRTHGPSLKRAAS
jgi:hypothetical protein